VEVKKELKIACRGKMTARERIDYLLDPKAKAIEIGAFVGEEGMYKEHGGCPSGGVVVKIGYIKGKQCVVVANDATVKAGAFLLQLKKLKSTGNSNGKPPANHLFGR
jgi:acetyl-CoA carboxylase carboxyltransferase component